jgi:hypothetical protein
MVQDRLQQPIPETDQPHRSKEPLTERSGWGVISLSAAALFLVLFLIVLWADRASHVDSFLCPPMPFLIGAGIISAVVGMTGGDKDQELAWLGLIVNGMLLCGCLYIAVVFSDL